jgi:hypothetical protein
VGSRLTRFRISEKGFLYLAQNQNYRKPFYISGHLFRFFAHPVFLVSMAKEQKTKSSGDHFCLQYL